MKNEFISSLHFEAIPGQSAVDAAAILTHDVENTFANKDILTALAFDIKGAFDRVSKTRLIQRLWKEKIPLPLICWVSSFLKDRKAAARLDGCKRAQESIEIGVPQVSPVAPIRFLLFTASRFCFFFKKKEESGA